MNERKEGFAKLLQFIIAENAYFEYPNPDVQTLISESKRTLTNWPEEKECEWKIDMDSNAELEVIAPCAVEKLRKWKNEI